MGQKADAAQFTTSTMRQTYDEIRSEIDMTIEFNKLFHRVREHLGGLLRSWQKFLEPGGDVLYFSDLEGTSVMHDLRGFQSCVDKAVGLEKVLCAMQSSCAEAIGIVRGNAANQNSELTSTAQFAAVLGVRRSLFKYQFDYPQYAAPAAEIYTGDRWGYRIGPRETSCQHDTSLGEIYYICRITYH